MSVATFVKIAIAKCRLAKTGNPVTPHRLAWYVDMLKAGTPYSFSRFGDGEWNAVLGRQGANCDGHEYTPALGSDLRNALLHPLPYFYAMQPRAIKTDGREIGLFLADNKVRIPWHDSDVFHTANGAGRLFPLVNQLRAMKVVLVGPPHLRNIRDTVFACDHFIEVPQVNCYEKKDDIRRVMLEYGTSHGPAVFAISASMTANVLVHELFPLLGATCWLLDLGSLWDGYAGVQSRLYFGKSGWKEAAAKNLGTEAGSAP